MKKYKLYFNLYFELELSLNHNFLLVTRDEI